MSVCSVTHCRLPAPRHWLSMGFFVPVEVLILMTRCCFYTLLLLLLLSQLFTALVTACSSKLPIYLSLTFVSYPSSLGCLQFQESLSCSHELREFSTIFLFLADERFCTGLCRSHVFAWLFCFVITTATRNNIVKWYLHEKANAFLICFRGVQGGGRRLFCSSLPHFSSSHSKCLGTL